MTETLERMFAATHTIAGVPVMRNPAWHAGAGGGGPQNMYVDEGGVPQRLKPGVRAEPIGVGLLAPIVQAERNERFGETYGTVGEVIPSEWFLAHYAQNHSAKGVMVTREAAAAALHACAWPDSNAPCGVGSNTNDDDASFVGYDREGNCVVKLFMRGKGYFKVKIPRTMFLEIVDE